MMLDPERRLYYDLASHLGYASVNRMLDEMTSQEISEWKVYWTLRQSEHKSAK